MLDDIFNNVLRGKIAKVEGSPRELQRVQEGILKLAARRRSSLGRYRITTLRARTLYIRLRPEI